MRILFVGMSDSIHTVRWISQIVDLGWDIHLFSSTDNREIHPDFKNITVHHGFCGCRPSRNQDVRVNGIPVIVPQFASVAKIAMRNVFPTFRLRQLTRVIGKIKPDIIHSLEFQSAGYLTLAAKKRMKNFPPWIATNWGSDIYYFMNDPSHLPRIKEVLYNCDYYSCECRRDAELAKSLGLKGKQLPVLPNTGGVDLGKVAKLRASGLSSDRRLLLLKGYHGWAGRALVGLEALKLCDLEPSRHEIAIFSASDIVVDEARKFSKSSGIKVTIIPKSSYEEILRHFGKAKLYIGLSISDAISTSLLESMAMGAFPIQSNTSCANEWITDGVSGFIVPPEDPVIIADAISKALSDSCLIDSGTEINYRVVRERLDKKCIDEHVRNMYRDIFNESRASLGR